MVLFILVGIVLAIVVVVVGLKEIFEGSSAKEKQKYHYTRKQFFLTRAEHTFYDALVAAVGNEYHIFAQVHLSSLLDHKVNGQDWRAALAHIHRKSVDFVLCDKAYLSPKLAIELDDKSHERPDRQERDKKVELILRNAGLPLLRLENHGTYRTEEIAEKIKQAISGVPPVLA